MPRATCSASMGRCVGKGANHGDSGGRAPTIADASITAATSRSSSLPPVANGVVHRAVWKVSTSSGPRRMTARPASPRGIAAGARSPTTSIASEVSCRRSANRRLVLARMSSLITPLGRWVARIRCTPRLRPRWAMPTSAWRKSGCSPTKAANSSITTTRRASGTASASRLYAARSAAPTMRNNCSRRRSSACRQRRARSARRSSRSVTTPTT